MVSFPGTALTATPTTLTRGKRIAKLILRHLYWTVLVWKVGRLNLMESMTRWLFPISDNTRI